MRFRVLRAVQDRKPGLGLSCIGCVHLQSSLLSLPESYESVDVRVTGGEATSWPPTMLDHAETQTSRRAHARQLRLQVAILLCCPGRVRRPGFPLLSAYPLMLSLQQPR